MSFSNFNISIALQNRLKKVGFTTPTQVQEEVIPLAMQKKDLLVQAKTGSGKTAAFALPILNTILNNEQKKKPQIKALILTPTRELTLQVAEVFENFSKDFIPKIKVVSVIGGGSLSNQLLDIQKGCHIVVATSGRLLEIISKKQINLSNIEYFVLDEADKMLNLDFYEELNSILEILPKARQNLLFSATFSQKIYDISSKTTNNATKVVINSTQDIPKKLTQRAILVNKELKSTLLRTFIKEEKLNCVLVFMASRRACDNIAQKFRKYGFKASSFHGDLLQEQRVKTLKDFKNKKIDVLFSTDIGARGLDILNISCVVNFDLPRSSADYIHRIGRTARAGNSGLALSLLSSEDLNHFKLIEKKYKLDILKESYKDFTFVQSPIKQKGKAPTKGKRMSKKDKLRLQQVQDLSK